MARCVVIGASPQDCALRESLAADDFVICADGGLQRALAWGIRPNLVVGDYDSLETADILNDYEHLTLPVQKDDTDTVAAVKLALSRGFRDFLFLGCTGGRLDHTFANLTVLLYLHRRGAAGVLVDGNMEARILGAGRWELSGKMGALLSLFPFGTETATVRGDGVLYELDSLCLQVDFPLGVSNQIISDSAWIEVLQGTILMISEKR